MDASTDNCKAQATGALDAVPAADTKRGGLYVISGPSGVGKGTLVSKLLDMRDDVVLSISATTRSPRPGEVDGKNYFFLTKEKFKDLIDADGFIEWAEYASNFYGTPLDFVEEQLAAGKNVILEIEVQGAFQVKEKLPDATLIFIEPPSMDELERRIIGRGTESEDVIESRMHTARVEMERKMEYDIAVMNDDVDSAVARLSECIV
ncbi:MAG: guanylate kinase [Eggerthellaceae bacterium]|nr:guanylate kinase [Eggerthellaceae bacterium]